MYIVQNHLKKKWMRMKSSTLSLTAAARSVVAIMENEKVAEDDDSVIAWEMGTEANAEWGKFYGNTIRSMFLNESTASRLYGLAKLMEESVVKMGTANNGLCNDYFKAISKVVLRANFASICGDHNRNLEPYFDELSDVFCSLEEAIVNPLINLAPNMPFNGVAAYRVKAKRAAEILRLAKCELDLDSYLGQLMLRHKETPSKHRENGMFKYHDAYYTHATTIIFAAHTNTAGTIAWTLLHLAQDKQRWDKALAEANSVDLEEVKKGDPTEYKKMYNLPFVRALINEIQRLYPPMLAVRTALEDVALEENLVIPAGAKVAQSAWAIGHDTAVWGPNANEFFPERFEDKDFVKEKVENYQFHPFGAGSHPCLGEGLAVFMISFTICSLLKSFDMEIKGAFPLPDTKKILGTPFSVLPTVVQFSKK
jgi:hypothetical protein